MVGIDCKRGVEQSPFAPRLTALAITPDQADGLLDALVAEMEERFDLLCLHQGITRARRWRTSPRTSGVCPGTCGRRRSWC